MSKKKRSPRKFNPAPLISGALIVGAATAKGCDLIAMSTHGRTGVRRVLFGSVAESVLRTAAVPVLMVRMAAGAAAPAVEVEAR